MTKQEIDFKRAVEEARHNRENERLTGEQTQATKRGQVIKAVTDIVGSIARVKPGQFGDSRYSRRADDTNDASWWNNAPGERAGAHFSTDYPITGLVDPASTGKAIVASSLQVIPFKPVLGGIRQQKYFNYTLDQLFQSARQDNTAEPAYTKADIGKLLVSADSMYTVLEHVKLVVKLAGAFSEENRLHSREFAAAITEQTSSSVTPVSFNFMSKLNSFAEAAPTLEARINVLTSALNKWNIPNSMPFMLNHIWMVSRIFADGGDSRSEWSVFKPVSYYMYNPDGRLICMNLEQLVGANATVVGYCNTLLDAVEAMYRAIHDASFAQLVTGDFAKPNMFGTQESHYVRLPEFSFMDDTIPVTYNEEALSRIENITPVLLHSGGETKFTAGQYNIVERNGSLHQGVQFAGSTATIPDNFSVSVLEGDADAKDATFFIIGSQSEAQGQEPAEPVAAASIRCLVRPLLFTHVGQASTDEILVATRGMVNGAFAAFRCVFQENADSPEYQSVTKGAFVFDCGTELYGYPIVFVPSPSDPGHALYKQVYLPVMASTTDTEFVNYAVYFRIAGIAASNAHHYPKGQVYIAKNASQGPGMDAPGHDWAKPTFGESISLRSQQAAMIVGVFDNAVQVPKNNLTWCHNTAVMSAFKSTFSK